MDNIEPVKVTSKLSPFLQSDDKIINAVEKLSRYYQFCNQDGVKLFKKWQKPKTIKGQTVYFSGSLGEHMALDEMKDLLDRSKGKPWDTILTAIFLVKHYQTEFNLVGLHQLTPEEQKEYMQIIIDGQKAYEIVTQWLKPLEDKKKDLFAAIEAGNNIKIGNDRYDDFQVLKFGDVIKGNQTKGNQTKGMKLYEYILEINEPGELAEYFKKQSNLYNSNVMFITMTTPSKKREWKIEVNIYVIWNGVLYNINFGERRLNIDNTAGDRNPGRYIENHYESIWPLYNALMLKNKTKTMAIELQKKQVTRRSNVFEVLDKSPEASIWLEMFMLRIIDYIQRSQDEIVKGFTTTDYIRMLPDKSQPIELRVKINDHHSSFQSVNDAGSYLLKKYSSKLTDIVPVVAELPKVIGTQEHVESVIKYQQRSEIATKLEKLNYEDWKKNSPRMYKWFKDFINQYGIKKFIDRALEDNKYTTMATTMMHENIAYIDGQKIEVERKDGVAFGKGSILSREEGWIHDDEPLEISLVEHFYLDSDNKRATGNYKIRNHVNCLKCNKWAWYVIAKITFTYYKQIVEFFDIKETDLPIEFVEHLHQQNEVYVGNSILDDTDPVDEIKDHWFRRHYTHISNDEKDRRADGYAYISVIFPLCKRCSGKLGESKMQAEKERMESRRKERWWDRRIHKEKS